MKDSFFHTELVNVTFNDYPVSYIIVIVVMNIVTFLTPPNHCTDFCVDVPWMDPYQIS